MIGPMKKSRRLYNTPVTNCASQQAKGAICDRKVELSVTLLLKQQGGLAKRPATSRNVTRPRQRGIYYLFVVIVLIDFCELTVRVEGHQVEAIQVFGEGQVI